MTQERLALLALRAVSGIGDHLFKQLINHFGSAQAVFEVTKGKLIRLNGIGDITAQAIRTKSTFHFAEQEYKKAERLGAQLIFFHEPKYPHRLTTVTDAPALLYVQGNFNLNRERMLAIVGTRKATNYGKGITVSLVEQLTEYNPAILSGLAFGIDIQAHKAALKANLPTVGILGSGLDNIYPGAHREVAEKMLSCGALISEKPFATKPDAHNFPARNRIIAGLCDALIVVEASDRGGALITARIANSYNRDVFAIPGNLNSPYSTGCNRLIRNLEAQLLTCAKDLEFHLNWNSGELKKEEPMAMERLEPAEIKVIETLKPGELISFDDLALQTRLAPGELSLSLLNLEFNQQIESLPGHFYKLRHGHSINRQHKFTS